MVFFLVIKMKRVFMFSVNKAPLGQALGWPWAGAGPSAEPAFFLGTGVLGARSKKTARERWIA